MKPNAVANLEPLGTRIRRQRRRLGLTLEDLARRCLISKPYLSLIENGRVTNPPSDEKLRRLEQAIGFKEGELLAQAHLQRTPSDVRAILQNLLQQAEAASNTVPLINAISAGYPTAFMDLSYPRRVAGEYVSGPEVQDRDAFAVRVVGNNMSPKYDEGDIVIFSPALPARSGDDCFVRFRDGTTTFKRVFLEGGQSSGPVWRLQTRCQAPPPQEIVSEDVIDLYRAVYRYQKVDGNT